MNEEKDEPSGAVTPPGINEEITKKSEGIAVAVSTNEFVTHEGDYFAHDEFFGGYEGKDLIVEIDEQIAVLIEEINAAPSGKTIDFAENLKTVVVDSILGPFGLSAAMFADKDGGNITTQHNANQGIFAKAAEEYERTDYGYDSAKKQKMKEAVKDGRLNSETFIDDYTGKVEASKRTTKDGKLAANFELDHAIPVSQLHKEGGWMLSPEERKDLSSTGENLYYTTHARNRDKSSASPEEYLSTKNGYDPNLIEPKLEQARAGVNEKLPDAADRLKYHGTQFALEGSKEAGKLALRQIVGIIFKDLATGLIEDVKQVICEGFQSLEQLVRILRNRMQATAEAIKAKWTSYLAEGASAGLAGLLSSLTTFLINSFITTAKRVVTIIREAVLAVVKSVKLIVSPPGDMTGTQIAAEVMKLLSGGLVLAATLTLQETVAKFLESTPFAPFAQDIATVLVGILSGTLGLLTILAFDKLKDHIAFQNKALADAHRGQAVTILRVKQTFVVLDRGYNHIESSNIRMHLQLEESKARFSEESKQIDEAIGGMSRAIQKLRDLDRN